MKWPVLAAALALAGPLPALTYALAPHWLFEGYEAGAARLDRMLAEGRAKAGRWSTQETYAAIALVAQEDRRIHRRRIGGRTLPWDLWACGRAVVRNLTSGRIREGCSTLAMQLAKLALPPGRDRGIRDKLLEARLAGRAFGEAPETLLSAYLGALPCASVHARGLSACALLRFGRPLDALDPSEAMVLAAAVQAPGRDLQATEASVERARARLDRVLRSAVQEGMLTPGQAGTIRAQDLRPSPPDLDLVRARAAGRDLELTSTLSRVVEASRARALEKLGVESDEDLLVVGAIYDERGRLRAQVGDPEWLRRPIELGSWVKPFVVEALLAVGVGRAYLSGDVQVPLHVPLVTRDLEAWHPRNAGRLELERAEPLVHVMRSINTGTLASLLYAFIYLPPDRSRALLERHLTPDERAQFSTPADRRLSREMASSYAGVTLAAADAPDLPGYRQISLGATRLVLRRMRAHIPELEIPHEDLAALLGVVRAPAEAVAAGLRSIWLGPDGALGEVGELMAAYADIGTLRWLGSRTPAAYKTATASRNAGLVALAFDRRAGATLQLVLVALRASGRPISPIQGATLGAGYPHLLSVDVRPTPEKAP